jgi:hypothetical protein
MVSEVSHLMRMRKRNDSRVISHFWQGCHKRMWLHLNAATAPDTHIVGTSTNENGFPRLAGAAHGDFAPGQDLIFL